MALLFTMSVPLYPPSPHSLHSLWAFHCNRGYKAVAERKQICLLNRPDMSGHGAGAGNQAPLESEIKRLACLR
jgi:hypothetical protein